MAINLVTCITNRIIGMPGDFFKHTLISMHILYYLHTTYYNMFCIMIMNDPGG